MSLVARLFAGLNTAEVSTEMHAALATGQGPSIAPKFSADIDMKMDDDGSFPAEIVRASIVYDAGEMRYRYTFIERVPKLGDDTWLNTTQWAYSNDTMFSLQNGQCLPAKGADARGGFFAQFGWLALAKRDGQAKIEGRQCTIYSYSVEGLYEARLCLDGDEPIQLNTTQATATSIMTYRNFRREAESASLKPPAVCDKQPAACGDGHVARRTVYIFHPADNFNIAGQDVADALGDATFLCSDKFMWVAGGYSLFSAFEVKWLEKFGQYANCPPDPTSPTGARCMGGDNFHVGRSTAFLMGDRQGQCDGDAPEFYKRLGVWYSMPVDGECKDGQELGEGSCSWSVERRVKTIDMACLFDKFGLEQMCQNASAPFTDVTLALINALDSDAAAEGGCPPVEPPSSCSANPGCAGLVGNCCPADDGMQLACCSQNIVV